MSRGTEQAQKIKKPAEGANRRTYGKTEQREKKDGKIQKEVPTFEEAF